MSLKKRRARLREKAQRKRKERQKLGVQIARLVERIKRLTRKIKSRRRRGLPNWLPDKFADEWRKPWTVSAGSKSDAEFKRLIWSKGYVSPNFLRSEAGGKLRHPYGCDVPEGLRDECQYHAFRLEVARHKLGDKAMRPGSWYRCPRHNSAVGGASASQHMSGWATDWFSDERARHGGSRFDAVMNDVFADGGRGYQGYVGGPIRHVDNGPKRQWVYA